MFIVYKFLLTIVNLFSKTNQPNRITKKKKQGNNLLEFKRKKIKKNLDPYGKRYYNKSTRVNNDSNKGKENA
jgi:hypothetical protein